MEGQIHVKLRAKNAWVVQFSDLSKFPISNCHVNWSYDIHQVLIPDILCYL